MLWTIPITFASSLSSVNGLRNVHFIDELLNAAPGLVPFFQIIAPFIVVIVNGALPAILTLLSGFEAPASRATVAASTFGKLASFMIIQTFFVRLSRSNCRLLIDTDDIQKPHCTVLSTGINYLRKCPETTLKYREQPHANCELACGVSAGPGKSAKI